MRKIRIWSLARHEGIFGAREVRERSGDLVMLW